jgi:hypothetical protein
VIIRQVPILLLLATAIFSLPFLGFSLFHVLGRTDAEGKWFTLVFGLLIGWLLLEFAATREKLEIDLSRKTILRTVSGVFRRKRQSIDLAQMKQINLQIKKDWRGRRYAYLYICGDHEQYLLNNPHQTLNHRATAKLLSEITGLSYVETGPVPLKPAPG